MLAEAELCALGVSSMEITHGVRLGSATWAWGWGQAVSLLDGLDPCLTASCGAHLGQDLGQDPLKALRGGVIN